MDSTRIKTAQATQPPKKVYEGEHVNSNFSVTGESGQNLQQQ